MPISIYAQDKMMDGLLAKPFISLHTKNPKTLGDNEVSGGSYARIDASALFSASKKGSKISTKDIEFKDLPECKISHVGIWDSEAGGNFLWSLELNEEQIIFKGNTFTIEAGKFEIGLY